VLASAAWAELCYNTASRCQQPTCPCSHMIQNHPNPQPYYDSCHLQGRTLLSHAPWIRTQNRTLVNTCAQLQPEPNPADLMIQSEPNPGQHVCANNKRTKPCCTHVHTQRLAHHQPHVCRTPTAAGLIQRLADNEDANQTH
jgi:hypothetical protein